MERINKKINLVLDNNNGRLMSKISEYKNAKTKLNWACSDGHEFKASWNKVQQGRWCPYCAGKHLSIADARNIAKERSGYCLSKIYTKSIDNLLWECEMGHQWKASFNHVKNNKSWCPYCSTNVGENICRILLNEIFKTKFIKIRPPWLTLNNSKLELDGYSESLGLAFEYQGPHHYGKPYKHQDLEKINKYDEFKKITCSDKGVKLFIIKYYDTDKIESIKLQLKALIDHFKLSVKKKVDDVSISDKDIYSFDYIGGLREIADENNGECLSNSYTGSKSKYKWKCYNGHIWESCLQSVKNGSWCEKCNNPDKMSINDVAREIGIIRDDESDLYRKRILQKAILYFKKGMK